MRLVAREVAAAGGPPIFFESPNGLLSDPRDWGMLAGLLAEDYDALGAAAGVNHDPTAHILDRFNRARADVGAGPVTNEIPASLLPRLARALDDEIASFLRSLAAELNRYDDSSSVVVELARGGPEGAVFPLPEPYGYQYTLPRLGAAMLRRASVLYVWVTPEESRRRNRERARPGREEEASALHHRVPDVVMRNNYGTDDLPWLIERGNGFISVPTDGESHRVAAIVFDNRSDFTSFLRADPPEWPDEYVASIHSSLKTVLAQLAAAGR